MYVVCNAHAGGCIAHVFVSYLTWPGLKLKGFFLIKIVHGNKFFGIVQ